MRYENENIWLTQKMMATLYDVDVRTINEHILKIYADSELGESATIQKFRIVQTEGNRQVTRDTMHYNLQMITAVGFKVNNERAVQFRKWAGQISHERAKLHAETEYEKYRIIQDRLFESDFDRFSALEQSLENLKEGDE